MKKLLTLTILSLTLIFNSGCSTKRTGATIGAAIGAGVAATGVASPYGAGLVLGGGWLGYMLSGDRE